MSFRVAVELDGVVIVQVCSKSDRSGGLDEGGGVRERAGGGPVCLCSNEVLKSGFDTISGVDLGSYDLARCFQSYGG